MYDTRVSGAELTCCFCAKERTAILTLSLKRRSKIKIRFMVLWNTTPSTRVPTCPEDGGSRFYRNAGSTYQVTRHDIPNGRIFTLTAMTNSFLQKTKLFSVATLHRLFLRSQGTVLVCTTTTTVFDATNSGLKGSSCDRPGGGMTGLRTARKMNRGSIPNRCTRWIFFKAFRKSLVGGGALTFLGNV